MAPIVSVNLSESAYAVYRRWKESRNGSRKVSFAITTYQLRLDQMALTEIGDRKLNEDGFSLVFTEEGWELE